MNCCDKGFIQLYIGGKLSYDIRKQFTKHLDTCEVCQDSLIKNSKLNWRESVMLKEEDIHASQKIKIDVEQAWEIFKYLSKIESVSYLN
ncbi:TPA: hypothetical protein QCU53_004722 [Bacillus thuringiensis]|nr:hypothetical protein [Bacillus thuringiensis]